jgi:hypothetical protein
MAVGLIHALVGSAHRRRPPSSARSDVPSAIGGFFDERAVHAEALRDVDGAADPRPFPDLMAAMLMDSSRACGR